MFGWGENQRISHRFGARGVSRQLSVRGVALEIERRSLIASPRARIFRYSHKLATRSYQGPNWLASSRVRDRCMASPTATAAAPGVRAALARGGARHRRASRPRAGALRRRQPRARQPPAQRWAPAVSGSQALGWRVCQLRCARGAAHRSRVRNRIEFERLATSSGARQSAPASAVRVAQVSSREPAGAINWHATSCVHQCKRAQCARAASTPVGRRGAYRAAKHTSRPDGKHAAQPQGHACARLGAGGSGHAPAEDTRHQRARYCSGAERATPGSLGVPYGHVWAAPGGARGPPDPNMTIGPGRRGRTPSAVTGGGVITSDPGC